MNDQNSSRNNTQGTNDLSSGLVDGQTDVASDDGQFATEIIATDDLVSIGAVLAGRFKILKRLGRGAFSSVYQANDIELDSVIAIKVFDPKHIAANHNNQQFKNEILLLRQLNHPNICRVYEYYEAGDVTFITMQWVDGQSLTQKIGQAALPLDVVTQIATQLLSALAYLEEHQVLHKDLKPDNILIDDSLTITIIDFGLGSTPTALADQDITTTPVYSPVEYLQKGQVNNTTDLYAFGVLLYQMLSGQVPFAGPNYDQLLQQKRRDKLPCELSAEGQRFYPLVTKCTASFPENRFKAVTEVKQQFDQLTKAPLESQTQSSKPFGLMGWGVALVAIVGLFGLGILALNGQLSVEQQSPKQPSLAVAVMPFDVSAEPKSWALGNYLSFQLQTHPQMQVVNNHRVLQLAQSLGYSGHLSEQQILNLIELLDVDMLISYQQIMDDLQQSQYQLKLTSVNGRQLTHIGKINVESSTANSKSRQSPWWRVADQLNLQLAQYLTDDSVNRITRVAAPEQLAAISEIKGLINRSQLADAQLQLAQMLEAAPQFALGYLYRGEVLLRSGDYYGAEQAYSEAIALSSNQPSQVTYSQLFAQARLADLADQTENAERLYLQLVEAFPNDIELKMMLAEFYEITEQPLKMKQALLAVVQRDRNHPQAWFMLGKVAYLLGDFDQAIDEYFTTALIVAKKLKNSEQQADVLNAFGVVYDQLGNYPLARDYYQQALTLKLSLKLFSSAAKTMKNIASVEVSIGELQQAKGYLQQALEIHQEQHNHQGVASVYNELGILEEELGNYDLALEYYRQALNLRLSSTNQMAQAESMNNVGFSYFMLMDTEHSLVYWRQAEQMYQQIQFPIGIVRVRQSMGQLELAKGNWRNAFQIFTNTLEDANKLNSIEERFVATSYLAKLSFLQGSFKTAIDTVLDVKRQAMENNDKRANIEFGLWLIQWYFTLGDEQKSAEIISDLQDMVDRNGSVDARNRLAFYHKVVNAEAIPSRFLSPPDKSSYAQSGLYIQAQMQLLRNLLSRPLVGLPTDFNHTEFNAINTALAKVDYTLFPYLQLEYLELQSVIAWRQQNWSQLAEHLRQAEVILRKVSGHWRSFQFDRLRAELAEQTAKSGQNYRQKAANKLQQLLKNIPAETCPMFLSKVNYFGIKDSLSEVTCHAI